jgi:hypothetical protein
MLIMMLCLLLTVVSNRAGTSWTAFLEQVGQANDLDSVIHAHDTYLHQMLDGALLGTNSGGGNSADDKAALLSKLNQLFSVILRFHDAQDALHHRINDTVSRAGRPITGGTAAVLLYILCVAGYCCSVAATAQATRAAS